MKKLYVVLALALLISSICLFGLTRLRIDNRAQAFIPESHEVVRQFRDNIANFGLSSPVIIGLVSDDTILEKLGAIEELHAWLETRPYVDQVFSLANAPYLSMEDGALSKRPIIEGHEGGKDLDLLKAKLLDSPHYKKTLYDENFQASAIIVNIKGDVVKAGSTPVVVEMTNKTETIAQRYHLDTAIGGELAINAYMGRVMVRDMMVLAPLVAIVLALILLLSLKRVRYMLLTLLSVGMGSIWSVGLMGLFNIPMTMISVAIPTLMVAVGSAYGIHVLGHYEGTRVRHPELEQSREGRIAMISETQKLVLRPVLLAALTTMAGFASLILSMLIPIRYFGLFAGLGVAVSVFAAVALIPIALILLPPLKSRSSRMIGKRQKTKRPKSAKSDSHWLFAFATRLLASRVGKIAVLSCVFLAIVFSLIGLRSLQIDNSMIKFFREDTPIAKADQFLRTHMLGTASFSLVIEADKQQKLLSRQSLLALERIEKRAFDMSPKITSITGVQNMYRQINMLMNDPAAAELSFFDETDEINDFGFAFSPSVETGGEMEGEADVSADFSGGFGDGFGEGFGSEVGATSTSDGAFSGGFGEGFGGDFESDAKLGDDVGVNDAGVSSAGAAASGDVGSNVDSSSWSKEDFNEIPWDPAKYKMANEAELDTLVDQYGLLLGGSYGQFANETTNPTQIQLVITLNTISAREDHDIMVAIEQIAAEELEAAGQDVRYWTTGPSKISWMLTEIVVQTQIMSILVSLALVALLLLWQFRSLLLALVGLIPLSLSVLIVFGVMSFAHMELNIGTALVASIAIGIGVDYTIHFIQAYIRGRRISREQALVESYGTTGLAILHNALSVALGFLVLAVSSFTTIQYVGILVAITMLTSSVGALIVLPMVLQWIPDSLVCKTQRKRKGY